MMLHIPAMGVAVISTKGFDKKFFVKNEQAMILGKAEKLGETGKEIVNAQFIDYVSIGFGLGVLVLSADAGPGFKIRNVESAK